MKVSVVKREKKERLYNDETLPYGCFGMVVSYFNDVDNPRIGTIVLKTDEGCNVVCGVGPCNTGETFSNTNYVIKEVYPKEFIFEEEEY